MGNLVEEIVCPKAKQHFMRQNKKVSREKVMMPGYFLIKMEPQGELLRVIKATNLVAEVMGSGGRPEAMKESEVEHLLGNAEKSKNEVEYLTNELVKIIDGPFSSFNGEIRTVMPEKNRVIVNVKIFQQITSVELNYLQIEKIS